MAVRSRWTTEKWFWRAMYSRMDSTGPVPAHHKDKLGAGHLEQVKVDVAN